MAYGRTRVTVNAGGMTQSQVNLILDLARNRAWDEHPSVKMREFYAMHIYDIESNPATSVLTGGWTGTASKFIESLKKLPSRVDVAALEEAISEVTKLNSAIEEIVALLEPDPWGQAESVGTISNGETIAEELPKNNTPMVGPGVYNFEGKLCAVKESKTNPGKHYAYYIRLENKKFTHVYESGLVYKLTNEMRVSAEAVIAINRDTIHTHNGRRVGSCCVCGRMLTKASSIDAGIGPICGGRVGL